MKKFINVLFVIGMALFATSAFADGFYFSAGGGAVVNQNAESNDKIIYEETEYNYDDELDLGPPPVLTTLDLLLTDRLKKKIDFSTGFAGYAAVGKRINKHFRVELEYAYKNTNADEVEETLTQTAIARYTAVTNFENPIIATTVVTTAPFDENVETDTFDLDADLGIHTIMLNAFLDIYNESIITPFIGMGVGPAIVNFKGADIEESDTKFAFQLMGGASFNLSDSLSAQGFYRFLRVPNANIDNFSFDINTHSVEFGLLYTF